jgi:hypothetical protein
VLLFYTCKAENVGVSGTLTMNEASLNWTITEAHDPPLVGATLDRSARIESYTKTFKQLSLGTITLEKGNGDMRIQATNIPGTAALDVRRIQLKRIN